MLESFDVVSIDKALSAKLKMCGRKQKNLPTKLPLADAFLCPNAEENFSLHCNLGIYSIDFLSRYINCQELLSSPSLRNKLLLLPANIFISMFICKEKFTLITKEIVDFKPGHI